MCYLCEGGLWFQYIGCDYSACMNYMDPDVRWPKRPLNLITHSLTCNMCHKDNFVILNRNGDWECDNLRWGQCWPFRCINKNIFYSRSLAVVPLSDQRCREVGGGLGTQPVCLSVTPSVRSVAPTVLQGFFHLDQYLQGHLAIKHLNFAHTILDGFFSHLAQMITCMKGCVVHNDLGPWLISSWSFSHKTIKIWHILLCPL